MRIIPHPALPSEARHQADRALKRISSVSLARIVLPMLEIGAGLSDHDPLFHGVNGIQALSKTREIVSRMKTKLRRRILARYRPLSYPGTERLHGRCAATGSPPSSSRSRRRTRSPHSRTRRSSQAAPPVFSRVAAAALNAFATLSTHPAASLIVRSECIENR